MCLKGKKLEAKAKEEDVKIWGGATKMRARMVDKWSAWMSNSFFFCDIFPAFHFPVSQSMLESVSIKVKRGMAKWLRLLLRRKSKARTCKGCPI